MKNFLFTKGYFATDYEKAMAKKTRSTLVNGALGCQFFKRNIGKCYGNVPSHLLDYKVAYKALDDEGKHRLLSPEIIHDEVKT
jgi:hypothetical protein